MLAKLRRAEVELHGAPQLLFRLWRGRGANENVNFFVLAEKLGRRIRPQVSGCAGQKRAHGDLFPLGEMSSPSRRVLAE